MSSTPTLQEEALLDLVGCCAEAATAFDVCAEGTQSPALRAAMRLRGEQCRASCTALRASCQGAATTGNRARPRACSGGTDADVFADYEQIESKVLSAFRDALDQHLADEIAATVVAHFEIALNQYMQMAALRPPRAGERRAAVVDSRQRLAA